VYKNFTFAAANQPMNFVTQTGRFLHDALYELISSLFRSLNTISAESPNAWVVEWAFGKVSTVCSELLGSQVSLLVKARPP